MEEYLEKEGKRNNLKFAIEKNGYKPGIDKFADKRVEELYLKKSLTEKSYLNKLFQSKYNSSLSTFIIREGNV